MVQDALGERFPVVDVVDEHTVGVRSADGARFVVEVATWDEPFERWEREDPETGGPLPAGVVGFPIGGRS